MLAQSRALTALDVWLALLAVFMPLLVLVFSGLAWLYKDRAERARRRLEVDWLSLFRDYYKIWSAIHGLKIDIKEFLRARHDGNLKSADHFAIASLYFHARASLRVEDFATRSGGLWILADAEKESELADAAVLTTWLGPFNEFEASWLRVQLASVDSEAHPFLLNISTCQQGRLVVDIWRTWLEKCACVDEQPDRDCLVHAVLKHSDVFQRIVDEEWAVLVPWYRGPSPRGADLNVLARWRSSSLQNGL